jgi:hypothetical protein
MPHFASRSAEFWLFLAILSPSSLCSCIDPCDNVIVAEYRSPDNNKKVVMFERGCGATTRTTIQLSLLDQNAPLGKGAGNIVISDRDAEMGVTWVSNDKIVVKYGEGVRLTRAEKKFQHVTIEYSH